MKTRYPLKADDAFLVHNVGKGQPIAVSHSLDGEHIYLLLPGFGLAVSFWKDGAVLYLSKATKEAITKMEPGHTRLVTQYGKFPPDKMEEDVYDKLVSLSREVHSTEELLDAN